MRVWVLQTGEPLHIDGDNSRPMRAINLCNYLVEAGHEVVLWSADFCHQIKQHRFGHGSTHKISEQLQIRLIYSRGYKRHIGVARMVDHLQLAINLKRELNKIEDIPDVAFLGYPPVETSVVMANWLKSRSVPTLLDVKDQWPALFLEGLPSVVKPIIRVAFSPQFYWSKRIMREVTSVSAMAEGYLNWIMKYSGRIRSEADRVFPLTTATGTVSTEELEAAGKWWDSQGVFDDGRITVCFIGSFSSIYDFAPVKDAASAALKESDKYQFVICGGGSYSNDIQATMGKLPNIFFPGWINRPQIEALAKRSIALLAPYLNVENYTANIPNKIVDAMSLGLAILSPLEGEVENLISTYGIGMKYGGKNDKCLFECIQILSKDPYLRKQISQKAKSLYEEKFQIDNVYNSLVAHLEQMAARRFS